MKSTKNVPGLSSGPVLWNFLLYCNKLWCLPRRHDIQHNNTQYATLSIMSLLCSAMLCVVMLSVVMLNVVMLNVVAPFATGIHFHSSLLIFACKAGAYQSGGLHFNVKLLALPAHFRPGWKWMVEASVLASVNSHYQAIWLITIRQ